MSPRLLAAAMSPRSARGAHAACHAIDDAMSAACTQPARDIYIILIGKICVRTLVNLKFSKMLFSVCKLDFNAYSGYTFSNNQLK